MRIVAIVQKLNHGTWWRVEQPLKFLYEAGVDTAICWLDSNNNPVESVKDSVVLLQRISLNPSLIKDWIANLKKLGAKKIVYDLDDDVISESYVEHMTKCGRASAASMEKLMHECIIQREFLRYCDEITVTTQRLKQLVHKYVGPDKKVTVLENSLDFKWYWSKLRANSPYQNYNNDPLKYITIGWAGGIRPREDYADMAEAWSYIDKKYENVRFVIGGFQEDSLYEAVDYDKTIRVPWAALDEWPRTMQVDIGCIPMADTQFNRCKSQIKVIEFALSGAIPIASHVLGTINTLNAVPFATSAEGWKFHIEYFIRHWLDRQLYVKRIQEQIESRYDFSVNYKKWQEVYFSESKSLATVS